MRRTSKTKYAILGMLSSRPMCGYEITKTIADSVAYFWSESHGQLYPSLASLTKEGLITITGNMGENTGLKAPKIYKITKNGRAELRRWLETPLDEEPPHRNEFLLKLFFGGQISKETCLEHIEHRRKWAVVKLEHYKEKIKQLKGHDENHPNLPYWLLTLEYGLSVRQAEIDWCIKSSKLLSKSP